MKTGFSAMVQASVLGAVTLWKPICARANSAPQ